MGQPQLTHQHKSLDNLIIIQNKKKDIELTKIYDDLISSKINRIQKYFIHQILVSKTNIFLQIK